MRTYLVTGGLGFLGAGLATALVQAGHRVRVLDNGWRGRRHRLSESDGIELMDGDIRDAKAVRLALRGVDGVCHLAFINGTRYFYEQPGLVLEVGVKGMLNVLDGCLDEGVRELVLVSSSEVYQTPPRVPTDESVPLVVPDPRNPRYSYGGAKIISELLALHYAGEHVQRMLIVRPHNVYGPDMGQEHVIPQCIQRLLRLKHAGGGEPLACPIQGTGEQTRSFLYVGDFVAGVLTVMARGAHRGIYHLGTTEELTIRDVVTRIARQLGVAIRLVPGEEAEGSPIRRCPDIRNARALGFEPRISFDEGLTRTIAWYVEHASPPTNDTQLVSRARA